MTIKLDMGVDRLWSQMKYAYEVGGGHSGHLNNAWHTAKVLSGRIEQLETEVLEQCRLNSMGGERELALLAKVERLERENAELQALLKTSMEQHEIVGRLHQEALAESAELRKDAERYRWLEKEHMRADPVCHLTWKLNYDRSSSKWVNTARLDAAIDEAMK